MDWTDGPALIAAVVALLALVGSFLSFLRSLAAERKAAAAEKRAEQAEQSANDARTRAAAALERANEIAEAQIPKPFVRWSEPVHDRGRGHYSVRNVGTAIAREAQVTREGDGVLAPDEDIPMDVDPGTSLGFVAMRTGAGAPVARIEWVDPDGARQRVLRRV